LPLASNARGVGFYNITRSSKTHEGFEMIPMSSQNRGGGWKADRRIS